MLMRIYTKSKQKSHPNENPRAGDFPKQLLDARQP